MAPSKDDFDHTSEEYTLRSPTTTLPDNMIESFPPQSSAVTMGGSTTMGTRPRLRSGVTDQLGLRGVEALTEPNRTGVPTTGTNMSNMSSGQASPPMVLSTTAVVVLTGCLFRISMIKFNNSLFLRLHLNSLSKVINLNSRKTHIHNTNTTGDTTLAR
ncbi:hypothetical protein JOM56_015206 [Amanita muscaria]